MADPKSQSESETAKSRCILVAAGAPRASDRAKI